MILPQLRTALSAAIVTVIIVFFSVTVTSFGRSSLVRQMIETTDFEC